MKKENRDPVAALSVDRTSQSRYRREDLEKVEERGKRKTASWDALSRNEQEERIVETFGSQAEQQEKTIEKLVSLDEERAEQNTRAGEDAQPWSRRAAERGIRDELDDGRSKTRFGLTIEDLTSLLGAPCALEVERLLCRLEDKGRVRRLEEKTKYGRDIFALVPYSRNPRERSVSAPSRRPKSWLSEALVMKRDNPELSNVAIAKVLGIHHSTLSKDRTWRHLNEMMLGPQAERRKAATDPRTGDQQVIDE